MIDLKFDHVSKRYRIPRRQVDRFARRSLLRRLREFRQYRQELWAVRDVSFEVRRGEMLGIIGHNGAGKSTILKLCSNITTPTLGEITLNGRLLALIEVGSGFHPELTGRENVYLSGSILGMRRREIAEKMESIVAFAGIEQFIDVPVKWYSSGMYVRLGFSIAAHLDPDILLLDEILAVGDAAFQARCIQRILDLKEAGKTIVYISHDLMTVERMCDRALLMERGQVIAEGLPQEVIARYQQHPDASSPQESVTPDINKKCLIDCVTFYDAVGQETSFFRTGSPLKARIQYIAREQMDDVVIELSFYSEEGKFLHSQYTTALKEDRLDLGPGRGGIEFYSPELGLQPGAYSIVAAIKQGPDYKKVDLWYGHGLLRVEDGKMVSGMFYMPHDWRVTKAADGPDGAVHDLASVNIRSEELK
ncbi:MAG TPA: ABC transporter ATP-binding protein [Blastocatellia bacterium]|nr:ABC transporter ATP-binding protein [Blastocatellia bacterium]